MADETLKRDQNFITVLGGITDDSDQEIKMLRVDPISKRLLVKASGIAAGVTSLNSLTGDVILAEGTNISFNTVGNTITISANDTDTGITQLTGDVTAGPGSGSQVATLATVNSNIGSFGTAANVGTFTVNAKGLITAASNTSIQIAESQVTNLVSDLGAKVPYTGATTNVNLGANTITAQKTIGSSGSEIWSGGTLDFFSDAGVTPSGDVGISSSGVYRFSNPGTANSLLDFSSLTTDRTFTFPDDTGTIALTSDLTGFITSVSGTANRITSTGGTTPAIDISASYVGQASITTLGTITTGVWNGTAIANANLANSSITIGSTAISLGATSTTLAGLTSVTSTGFTGALTGNATTATVLATGRTIAITGDLSYTSPSFDGSGNVTAAGTLATVNANVGTFGSATQAPQLTVNGKGLITAVSNVTVTPAVGSITGLGTGVATALGVNVGSAGAFVTFNGALGTPSSGTLTNATGLPISSGVSGLGANVATFLATPSSANLASAVTGETGSGALVFGTSPTITTGLTLDVPLGGGITFNIPTATGQKARAGGLPSVNNWFGNFLNVSFNGSNWELDDTAKDGWFFKLDARTTGSTSSNGIQMWRVPNGANPHTDEQNLFSVTGGETVLNEGGVDQNFRVESDTNDHAFFVDGATGYVGIGVTNPLAKLSINADGAGNHLEIGYTAAVGAYFEALNRVGGAAIPLSFYVGANSPIQFYTNATKRISIMENSGNIKIAGTALRATTEGTNHLDIFDGTAPVGTLANGISIYSSAGEGYMMDAAGNATLQTPHDKEGYWIYKSTHTPTGKVLIIEIEKMLKILNLIYRIFSFGFSKGFIKEFYE